MLLTSFVALAAGVVAYAAPAPDLAARQQSAFPQPANGVHREFYLADSGIRLALNYTGGAKPNFRRPPDGTAVILADGKFGSGSVPTTPYTWSTWRAENGWKGVIKQYDSDEMCLDVGHGPALGSKVKVWYCHGAAWQLFEVDNFQLKVQGTNLCVGYTSATDLTQAVLVSCNAQSASWNSDGNKPYRNTPTSQAPSTSSASASPTPGPSASNVPGAKEQIFLYPPNSKLQLQPAFGADSNGIRDGMTLRLTDPPGRYWTGLSAATGWQGVIKVQSQGLEKCLDVGNLYNMGTKVTLQPCTGVPWQEFIVDAYRLQLANTGYCVGYSSASAGADAELVSCQNPVASWNRAPDQPFQNNPSASMPTSSSSSPPPIPTSSENTPPPSSSSNVGPTTSWPGPSPGTISWPSSSSGSPTAGPSESGAPVPGDDGHRSFLYVPNSNLWLIPQFASGDDTLPYGTPVVLADPNENKNFDGFFAHPGWNGAVKVQGSKKAGCLDAGNGQLGQKIIVGTCIGGPTQEFVVDKWRLQLKNTGFCVGWPSSAAGTQAELISCQRNPNSLWNSEANKPPQYDPSSSAPASTTTPAPTTTAPVPGSTGIMNLFPPNSKNKAYPKFDASGNLPDGTVLQLVDSTQTQPGPNFAGFSANPGWQGVVKVGGTQKCLDSGNGNTGATVTLQACTGAASQQFIVSTNLVQLKNTGFCVGRSGTDVGTQLTIQSCQNTGATLWNTEPNQPPGDNPSSSVSPSPSPSPTSIVPQPSGGAHREFYFKDSSKRLALDFTGSGPTPQGTKVTLRDGVFVDGQNGPTSPYKKSTWRAANGWRGVVKNYDSVEMCLDAGDNPQLGSKIVVNSCSSKASQDWIVDPWRVQLANTGFCVGVPNDGEGVQAELVSCQNPLSVWNDERNRPLSHTYAPSSTPPPTPSTTTQSTAPTTTGFPQPANGAHREFYVYNSPIRLALNYTGGAKPNFRRPPDGTAIVYTDGKFVDGRPTTPYTWSTFRAENNWRGVIKMYDTDEMCLDVGHGPALGSKVKVWYCHGAAWQQFWVSQWRIQVAGTNLCVGSETYTTEGQQAILVGCDRITSLFNPGPNQPTYS